MFKQYFYARVFILFAEINKNKFQNGLAYKWSCLQNQISLMEEAWVLSFVQSYLLYMTNMAGIAVAVPISASKTYPSKLRYSAPINVCVRFLLQKHIPAIILFVKRQKGGRGGKTFCKLRTNERVFVCSKS